jgi:hypothetical protein
MYAFVPLQEAIEFLLQHAPSDATIDWLSNEGLAARRAIAEEWRKGTIQIWGQSDSPGGSAPAPVKYFTSLDIHWFEGALLKDIRIYRRRRGIIEETWTELSICREDLDRVRMNNLTPEVLGYLVDNDREAFKRVTEEQWAKVWKETAETKDNQSLGLVVHSKRQISEPQRSEPEGGAIATEAEAASTATAARTETEQLTAASPPPAGNEGRQLRARYRGPLERDEIRLRISRIGEVV